MHLTLDQIVAATRGKLLTRGSSDPIRQISTDTRTTQNGDCFIALKGEKFDGHAFLEGAVSSGARTLIISERPGTHISSEISVVEVEDTTRALGDIGQFWRQCLTSPTIAAIVGSSGKTTIKEMAAALVLPDLRGIATEKNLNNLIGVPQMIFRLQDDHRAAILELGMNVAGELSRLVDITRPQILVLANILNAHVGNFGSIEGLYQAKAESLRALPSDSIFVCNADDQLSLRARDEFAGSRRVLTYGLAEDSEITARNIVPISPFGFEFDLAIPGSNAAKTRLNVFGRHNIHNALAAAAAAHLFGVSAERIAQRLSDFKSGLNRSEVENVGGVWIIKDYYNASPAAMEQALLSLKDMNVPGKRYAVLGDMLELGVFEEQFHRRAGAVAAQVGIAFLATVGDRARMIHEAAQQRNVPAGHFRDAQAATEAIHQLLQPGDALLIKASRLMKLESVYNGLKELMASQAAT